MSRGVAVDSSRQSAIRPRAIARANSGRSPRRAESAIPRCSCVNPDLM